MSGATSQHTTSYPPTRSAISGRTLSGSFLLPIATLRAFLHRRAQFAQFRSASAPSLAPTRYFRLMALSLELLLSIPLSTYGLYLRHPALDLLCQHARGLLLRGAGPCGPLARGRLKHTQANVELSRWAGVLCAFAFFAFFGFAAEARKHYALGFWPLATRVGYKRPADERLPWSKAKSASGAAPTLPISLPRTLPKPRPESLTASLADTRTVYDDDTLEKIADYLVPTPPRAQPRRNTSMTSSSGCTPAPRRRHRASTPTARWSRYDDTFFRFYFAFPFVCLSV
ncbi:hypothetical protein B0H11DRAFT_1286636 [Mycena galericulata]|nr:hypothetical protein B0H11DRAFT_1286636 [Mycena galericulata]